MAYVVLAIGDQDHGLAHRLRAAFGEQLVAACCVDGIEEGRATAGAYPVHAGLQGVDVVGPVLIDPGGFSKIHHEGAIAFCLEDLQQKFGRRLLLELEARADRGAGVDDDSHAQPQIDLLVEGVHFGRSLLVVEQGKVTLLEVGNIVAVLVGNGEDQVDLVDGQPEYGGSDDLPLLIGGLLNGRRLRRLGWGRGLLSRQGGDRQRGCKNES